MKDVKREIKLIASVPAQAPQYTKLYVNGILLGEYICGKDKVYLDPERWAEQQLKKREEVINRNIERLEEELRRWKNEKKVLEL